MKIIKKNKRITFCLKDLDCSALAFLHPINIVEIIYYFKHSDCLVVKDIDNIPLKMSKVYLKKDIIYLKKNFNIDCNKEDIYLMNLGYVKSGPLFDEIKEYIDSL